MVPENYNIYNTNIKQVNYNIVDNKNNQSIQILDSKLNTLYNNKSISKTKRV